MARFKDKEAAIKLRKQGKSYSQIKSVLGVGKGTLSEWLQGMPLSKGRIRELRDWNEQRIERYRETRRINREAILRTLYREEKAKILPLSKRDLFIAGLFLYWGEGLKQTKSDVSISNTDPSIIRFFLEWLTKIFQVPKEKFRIYLHLYQDMDIKESMNYWSKTLGIPLSQFRKPYIKKGSRLKITYKGGFGQGTCNASVGDATLSKRVLMAIKALSDKHAGA